MAPQTTPARQQNDPQTIPWKRAWHERERSRAPRVSKILFWEPPRTVVRGSRGSPSTDLRQTTKRHPNDTLETRMSRAGALQGARGIKSILSGQPSPSRAFLPPQDRVQGLARKRPPPDNETTPKRYPGNAHNATESAPGHLGYQKYCFRIPSTKPRLLARPMARGPPQTTPARQRNDPQTIPWKRARHERERSRAPRVSKV